MRDNDSRITGIVLAGGMGRRMGGVDKGLLRFHGKPLVAHVLDRLRPQVDAMLINANRELETYRSFGCSVVPDSIPGYAGPLAGLHCGMSAADTPLVVTVPCDAPLLPADLVTRQLEAFRKHRADVVVARTGDQLHPVFCLCPTALLPQLTRFLQEGGRKVETWCASLKLVEVSFDDESQAFANINTPEQLACLQQPA